MTPPARRTAPAGSPKPAGGEGGARPRRRRRSPGGGTWRHRSPRWSPRCCSSASASARRGAFLAHLTVFVLAVLRRLAGRLERDARAAHAADERHQRDQRHHPRRRHAAAHRAARIAASAILGAVAILLATINIAGGFLVTQRMLRDVPQARRGSPAVPESLVTVAYIVAGVLFILSLGGLSRAGDRPPRQPASASSAWSSPPSPPPWQPAVPAATRCSPALIAVGAAIGAVLGRRASR